ncbi:MAG: shikimate dehydrogenase [Deltaproteobacteria bacterium]|nr:shikimate dehydrogenase [Deltaproteobacteria bacterium]
MKITGATRIIGIFGDPIEHTLSPAIQNAAIEESGVDLVYVPFHVTADGLKAAVNGIRALDMAGVNVTIPHKERVVKLLDDVDPLASLIGAVNTIVNVEGRLIGYNTDGYGYVESLKEDTGFTAEGKNVVVIGAGGAARAILYTLMRERSASARSIILANRTYDRAKRLAKEFKKKLPWAQLEAVRLDAVYPYMDDAHLVVNTTSLGMMAQSAPDLPIERLPETAIVSDVVYRPLETALLKKAAQRGLKTHSGLGMLVHQGALSFELWTLALFPRPTAPIQAMRRAALKALGSSE